MVVKDRLYATWTHKDKSRPTEIYVDSHRWPTLADVIRVGWRPYK